MSGSENEEAIPMNGVDESAPMNGETAPMNDASDRVSLPKCVIYFLCSS